MTIQVCQCSANIDDDGRKCRCVEQPDRGKRMCSPCRGGRHVGVDGERVSYKEARRVSA